MISEGLSEDLTVEQKLQEWEGASHAQSEGKNT